MEKELLLTEINKEVSLLDDIKLKEVFDFIRFLRNREYIDPTLEILQNDEDYLNIKKGIQQKKEGKVFDWDSVK